MKVRRLLVLLLCLVLLLPACSPAPPLCDTPGAATPAVDSAPPVEPATVIASDSLTITMPLSQMNGEYYDLYRDSMVRMQGLLSDAGWKVTLSPLSYTVPDGLSGNDEMLYAIRTQTAAGQPPDAWLVSTDFAKLLRAEGLTRDMADVLPRTAPILWETCKGALTGTVDGVPTSLSLSMTTKEGPVALLMSTEALTAYGHPIANAEDVLTYLEKTPDALISDSGLEYLLANAWAAQQGYYALSDYGLSEFFYARQDDPDCKIVPMEDLPDFAHFYLRSSKLQAQQERPLSSSAPSSAKATGMLVRMKKGADHNLQEHLGLMGKDITALPLAGCNPAPTMDTPAVYSMLAVAGDSDKAAAVAGLAQWALFDQKGYDLCTLGQPDKDYRLAGDRVEYLNAGASLVPADWVYSPTSPVFNHFALVFNPAMQRFTVYEAANAGEVLAEYHAVTPPIWKAKVLRAGRYQLPDVFTAAEEPYKDLMSQRLMDLNYSVPQTNNVPDLTPEQVLQRLRDNRSQLDPLIKGLSERLKLLLDNPNADPTQTATAS